MAKGKIWNSINDKRRMDDASVERVIKGLEELFDSLYPKDAGRK